MADIFFASDHHFNHDNILTFKREDGTPLRPEFTNVAHMNEYFIFKHNSVVKPQDKVYFLGDVCMKKDVSAILPRLNGKKRLVLGNHDDVMKQQLWMYFQKIYAWRLFKEFNFIATHVPIHRESFRKVDYNVHGHTHTNRVMTNGKVDKSYTCVCMEQLPDYTPISIEEVTKRLGK